MKEIPNFVKYVSWFESENTWFKSQAFWFESRTKSDLNQIAQNWQDFRKNNLIQIMLKVWFKSNQTETNMIWEKLNWFESWTNSDLNQIRQNLCPMKMIKIKLLSWVIVQFDKNKKFSVKLSNSNQTLFEILTWIKFCPKTSGFMHAKHEMRHVTISNWTHTLSSGVW